MVSLLHLLRVPAPPHAMEVVLEPLVAPRVHLPVHRRHRALALPGPDILVIGKLGAVEHVPLLQPRERPDPTLLRAVVHEGAAPPANLPGPLYASSCVVDRNEGLGFPHSAAQASKLCCDGRLRSVAPPGCSHHGRGHLLRRRRGRSLGGAFAFFFGITRHVARPDGLYPRSGSQRGSRSPAVRFLGGVVHGRHEAVGLHLRLATLGELRRAVASTDVDGAPTTGAHSWRTSRAARRQEPRGWHCTGRPAHHVLPRRRGRNLREAPLSATVGGRGTRQHSGCGCGTSWRRSSRDGTAADGPIASRYRSVSEPQRPGKL
mmetsp:Transcript_100964/g.311397  ORF Transcript_100964/g.311397 Transcript_100964/m.311397 type:complete len:318 (-) Transcript_100964:213-1166(-)